MMTTGKTRLRGGRIVENAQTLIESRPGVAAALTAGLSFTLAFGIGWLLT